MTEKKKTASSRKIEQDLFMEDQKPAAAKKPSAGKRAASGGSGKAGSADKAAAARTASAKKSDKTANTRTASAKKSDKAANARTASAKKTDKGAAGKAASAPKPASARSAARRVATPSAGTRSGARKKSPTGVQANPVAEAAVRRASSPQPRRSAPRPVLAVSNAREDDYDRFLRQQERPHRAKKKARKKGHFAATLLLLLLIGGAGALVYRQNARYTAFAEMKAAVNRQTFYQGTTVDGVDVSGMTLEQALDYWETNIEAPNRSRTVALSNGTSYTAQELGYQSDAQAVLSIAYSAGRSGSLEERYRALNERAGQPANYQITRTMYDSQIIAAYVSQLAAEIDTPATDARIESFDTSSYQFTFTEGTVGKKLDTDALKADIARALENGGGSVELRVSEIQPSVQASDISSQYGLIAYAVTNASSSSSNRLSNIRLALQLINGTRLAPGESFSFNDTVGKRTTERGFKVATAYSSGEVTEDVGGGICQVSTTLFNAVVKADMQIDERHNHSLTVSYVDKGKDAAVNWRSQDLRFTNTSSDDVYLVCVLTDDKRVRVGVFGKLLPNGETIEIDAETTGTIDYETVYQPSLSLAPGTQSVVKSGKKGYTAVAYKVRKDASGNTISRELLCKSSYKATNQVIEYGP